MEDVEKITTEVTERAQAYLNSRRNEARKNISVRISISNNWVQKPSVEDLQSARYQGDRGSYMQI